MNNKVNYTGRNLSPFFRGFLKKQKAEFGKGGESAKKAFSETVKALSSIEDPLEKDAAGVALFGTMWEDLGPDVIAQLGDIESGAYSTGDALEEIQDIYNGI